MALRPDSGGQGTHRGGLGAIRENEILADNVSFTYRGERHFSSAKGLFGGGDGARAHGTILRRDGSIEEIPSKIVARLHVGDRVVVETAGDPALRHQDAMRDGIADGKVTGDTSRAVHPDSTVRLRQNLNDFKTLLKMVVRGAKPRAAALRWLTAAADEVR
jgi:N-methylhydantoinase B/oxoprolinase/acetone carboxylase alpha subunit